MFASNTHTTIFYYNVVPFSILFNTFGFVLMSLLEEGNADDVEGSETFAGDEHDALMEEVRPCIKIAAVARSLR